MRRILAAILCAASLLAFVGCDTPAQEQKIQMQTIISWNRELLDSNNPAKVMEQLKPYVFTRIAQAVEFDELESKTVKRNIEKLSKAGYSVYALLGDPAWIDPTDALKYIDAVADSGIPFSGIIFDIEWYQGLSNPDVEHFTAYVKAMKTISDSCHKHNLKCICLTCNWSDSISEKLTNELINYNNIDELMFMNYKREFVTAQLDYEYEACKAADKPMEALFETDSQQDDSLTYWNIGLNEMNKDILSIQSAYPGIAVGVDYLTPLTDMMKNK